MGVAVKSRVPPARPAHPEGTGFTGINGDDPPLDGVLYCRHCLGLSPLTAGGSRER